jgi:hypothetical protein
MANIHSAANLYVAWLATSVTVDGASLSSSSIAKVLLARIRVASGSGAFIVEVVFLEVVGWLSDSHYKMLTLL